ncbi:uncharacterized protein LOC128745645 [Sabethes cyaneus]|uniref:uncharacterized protein LOC128745645 n=1 Tax=Sabethes cyaneus TaxID=53552 RepID=UPI00237D8223|nr:uncharacterized protein LOC128745645 [Sabethes cyaneus]
MGACGKCDHPDNDEMVCCDECESWWHYGCVGESPGVANREFRCEKCAVKKGKKGKKSVKNIVPALPNPGLPLTPNPTNPLISGDACKDESTTTDRHSKAEKIAPSVAGDDAKSVMSSTSKRSASRLQLEIRRVEEELRMKERQLEEDRLIREKQLEMERTIAQKRLQQEKKLQEQMLAQEEELLRQRLAEEVAFQHQQRALREKYQKERFDILANELDAEEGAVGGERHGQGNLDRVHEWLADNRIQENHKDRENLQVLPIEPGTPKRNPGIPITAARKTAIPPRPQNMELRNPIKDTGDEDSASVSTVDSAGPTRAQRAARQVLSKKLPTFSGRVEEWPLFYSSYVNSTAACGFTNIENLVRLQECLKGPALDSVRSRLLLPGSVPQVIHTLQMLYGRPEQVIHSLLNNVRKTKAPEQDHLETFIPFGLAVQELCDHLDATDLRDYLTSPILIQELIDRLPDNTKREWVQFKSCESRVTLRTFADFTTKIMSEASEVLLVVDTKARGLRKPDRPKDKGFLHAHRENEEGEKYQPQCRICLKNGHRVRNCDAFRCMNLAERIKLKEQYKLCERCLNEHEGWCKFKITCNVGRCRERHHPLVHRMAFQPNIPNPVTLPAAHHHAHGTEQRSIIFRIVPVTLYHKRKAVATLAYLDEGSSMTLVEEQIITELGMTGKPQPLTLQWTGNITRQELGSECVSLQISGSNEAEKMTLSEARTVKKLYLPKQRIDFADIVNRYEHLNGLYAENQIGNESKILIGLNNVHLLAPLESRVGRTNEPIAVRSQLGWTIYGPRGISSTNGFLGCHYDLTNQKLHDQMREYFAVEEAGITVNQLPESKDERRAKELLEVTTVRINGHFETGLLWKSDTFQFPDSYAMAYRRLCSLERRLRKNPTLEQTVRKLIDEYQAKNYAHKATVQELVSADPQKMWYLPLSIVLHPKKPNKVRLVWDAAAQVNGVSLNSMLLTGPDMLTSLPAIIQQFRVRAIAFGADIREMFHQLRIRQADKHAQRFLFRTDPSAEPDIFLMDVATFGAACSPASAQYIKNLNASQHAEEFPDAAKAIICRHYVDDYLDSTDTVEEAVERAQKVRFVHAQAGFDIRNWISNSTTFLQALGENAVKNQIPLQMNEKATERVLGIIWNPHQDYFTFSTSVHVDLQPYLTGDRRPTKRMALRCIMSLFDPVGLLAPFTIQGKILLQDLWRTGCEWDQLMNDSCFANWSQWSATFPYLENVKIPRCYLKRADATAYDTLQHHVFVDASEQAYGAVSYFRIDTSNGPHCALIMAKTKVAPLKQLSIPRMELQAAVIGARLINTVEANHGLKVKKRVLWTDSRNVLSWIRSEQRRYKPFVAFRIGEILLETKIDEWRWVPTKANIADILTKWDKESFNLAGPWLNGPQFLQLPEELWPKQTLPPPNTNEEVRGCYMFHTAMDHQPLIDVTRISTWTILLRTICYALRFVSNCRRKVAGLPIEVVPQLPGRILSLVIRSSKSVIVPLKQEEYELAETILWKIAQHEHFSCELAILTKNLNLPMEMRKPIEKNSVIYRASPFLDEQYVLRMDGRTKMAEFIPYDIRFPIILPRNCEITRQLLFHYHCKYGHANRETVFNEIRRRFYIPKLRTYLASTVKDCQLCKIRNCRPQIPEMAPLPVERLTPFLKPFSHVGVDYFGPVEVSVNRRIEKRWIVLFTCLSVRAIHMEVAHRLDTDSCIMAIRRFVLRRGAPISIFSDNGTNLKAASKELQKQIRQIDTACANVFTNARTRWSFNPPSAPHMGGIWERMVRAVKVTMATLSAKHRMNDEILLTVIAEAEEIVNRRPLVYVPQ